jgi:hypothetical protein
MRLAFPRGIDLEFAFAQKGIQLALFFAVLLLALYLRIIGLSWGLTVAMAIIETFSQMNSLA